jgi:thiamine-monophosphate kinase
MKLTEIGEFGFINRFSNKFDSLIKNSDMGIGDDCAIISINETDCYVATTDLLIEDVHFLKNKISPSELGYKSLAVNLSDIAAMGAQPLYSFLSIGIPEATNIDYLDGFMAGYQKLSEKFGVPLMGGDTTKSIDKLVINVLVIGQCKKSKIRLRSMAQNGDLLCVTGNLGDSAAGLKVMLDKLELNSQNKELIQRHHLPEPRINEGQFLAKQDSVHAMMDISDGIASDLTHILKDSQKSATVHLDKLPTSDLLQKSASINNWDIFDLASAGGEDYELLFSLSPKNFEQVNSEYKKLFLKQISVIGEISDGQPKIKWLKNGTEIKNGKSGFNHFKNR